MAHVRRKFVDVRQSQGPAVAEAALRRIAELHAVASEARGRPPGERARLRRERSAPLLDDPERWLGAPLTRIAGKTPLAGAIRYALGRLPKLRPCLDDGRLELDTNAAERGMRGVAVGRKNWLFAGCEGGSRSAAVAFTRIARANSTASIRRRG